MDSARRAPATGPAAEALDFVRFCYQRRRLGWPELYDEMCTVAGRGLFRGWGADDLAAVGIGFSLFDMPALAAMSARIVAEETAAGREQGRSPRPRTGFQAPGAVQTPDGAMPGEPEPSRGTEPGRAAEPGRAVETGRAAGEGFIPMILARGAI
jgi:hypothetical protein